MTVFSLYMVQSGIGCQQNPGTYLVDTVAHFFDVCIPEMTPRFLIKTLLGCKVRKGLIFNRFTGNAQKQRKFTNTFSKGNTPSKKSFHPSYPNEN